MEIMASPNTSKTPVRLVNQKAFLELLKSIGRGLWFALLGTLSTALLAVATNGFGDTVGVELFGQYIDIAPALTLLLSLVAKGIDRYIHENRSLEAKGIAPKFLQR